MQRLNNPKRILVIGCSGGGKSTITRELSKRFALPAVHLDTYFWQPGWVMTPKDRWQSVVADLAAQDEWVMDGTFDSSFNVRFPRADHIIWVRQSRCLCLWRAILRVFKYDRVRRRPDMAEGCEESFDLEFYRYIWNFERDVVPEIHRAIQLYKCEDKLSILLSDADIAAFLAAQTYGDSTLEE